MARKTSPRNRGSLVVVGGREDKEDDCVILREVVRLLKGGKLVVATVASEIPDEYFEPYQKVFRRLGVKQLSELYVKDRSESMDAKKLKVLDDAAGIFFTGGDQLRISSQIGDTPFETRVRDIYRRGGVVAGTSAGASVMGETMLVKGRGGESYKIGDVHLAPGLGFIPNVIIDQHFAERGRIGRLLGAIAHNPRLLGIGIDEDTAIMKYDDGFSVIGSGAVYVADGAGMIRSNITEAEPKSVLSIFGMTLHVLSAGDRFDLLTRQPRSAIKARHA